MPEYNLPIRSKTAQIVYNSLDSFTQGYIQAMFFTEDTDERLSANDDATFDEMTLQALQRIKDDCKQFQDANDFEITVLKAWVQTRSMNYDDEAMGRDFWYTRNHHGVGFWDRGFPESIVDAMMLACKNFPQVSLYRGDDEKLYLE